MDGGLLGQIRAAKHSSLRATETMDKSGPFGVSDANVPVRTLSTSSIGANSPSLAQRSISSASFMSDASVASAPEHAPEPKKKKKSSKDKEKRKSEKKSKEKQLTQVVASPVASSTSTPDSKRSPSASDTRTLSATGSKLSSRAVASKDPIYHHIADELDESDEITLQQRSMLGSLYFLSFLAAVDFSIVFPAMYQLVIKFGGSVLYYGIVFAIYSATQFVAAIWMGSVFALRPIKPLLIACTVLLIAGNVVYTLTDSEYTRFFMIIGRALCGMGGGVAVFGYAHIARYSPKPARAARFALFRCVEVIGTVAGPCLGALLVKCDFAFFMTVDQYTICTFAMIPICSLFLIFLCTEQFCVKTRQWGMLDLFGRTMEEEEADNQRVEERRRQSSIAVPEGVRKRSTWALLYIFVCLVVAFWAFLATYVPLAKSEPLASSYYRFLYIAALFLVSFLLYVYKLDSNSTRMLQMSVLIMLIGTMLLTDFSDDSSGHDLPEWQVWVASAFLVLGFSFGTVQLPSMFARITMTKAPTLARTISTFFALVSLGRCLGPVFGAWAFQLTNNSLNLVAHSSAGLLVTALLVGFMFLNKRTLTIDTADDSENLSEGSGLLSRGRPDGSGVDLV